VIVLPDATRSEDAVTPGAHTQNQEAVSDTKAQTGAAIDTLATIDGQVTGQIIAAIQKPWAVDADGKRVPVSLSVEGDVVTMTVDHRGGDYKLPIIADPYLIDCAHASPCGTYHGDRAAAYAARWRASHNPSYKSFDEDCTNFMSQILRAGGLGFMRNFETGPGSWWMTKNGPFWAPWNWTRSWSLANELQHHLREYGLARVLTDSWRQGDFIAYDWQPDGTYDHINFVYRVENGEPYLLQHTPSYTTAKSFSAFRKKAAEQSGYFRFIHLRPVHAFANIG